MGRKMVYPERSRAILNDAWDQVRALSGGISPGWPWIGICQIVDRLLVDNPALDGRDISDAIVLCWRMEIRPTSTDIVRSMERVDKGRQGASGYS